MSKPKFTPGPWKVYDVNEPGELLILAKESPESPSIDDEIAIVYGVDFGDSYRPAGPNAHLIAAAPEMYEWMATNGELLAAVQRGDILFDDMPVGWLQRLCALLAKARGEGQ